MQENMSSGDLHLDEKGELMEGGKEESGQWNKVVSSMKQMLQELDELVPGTGEQDKNFPPSLFQAEESCSPDVNSNPKGLLHSSAELLPAHQSDDAPSGDIIAPCTGSSSDDIGDSPAQYSVFMFKPSDDTSSDEVARTHPQTAVEPPQTSPVVVQAVKSKPHELIRRETSVPKAKKKRSSAFNKWQRLITISSFLATKNKNGKSRGSNHQQESAACDAKSTATTTCSSNHHSHQLASSKSRRALTIQSRNEASAATADDVTDCNVDAEKNVDRFSFNNFFSRSYSVEETAVRTPPLSIPNHRILKSTGSSKNAYKTMLSSRDLCAHQNRETAEQAIAAGNIFNQPEFFRTCSCDGKECNSPDGNRQHLWQQQRQTKLSSGSVVWTPNFSSKRMQLRRIVSSDKKMSEHNLFENRQLQSFRDPAGSSVSSGWAEENDEQSKKNKKSRFKKSFKSVSKQLSAPIASSDHFLERKWETYGECIWCNLSGQQVELESTELSKLSELECEALQKVAIENINDLDLGVPVVIPKDDYSCWKQKHKLKKKYLLLMAKEKQKDKDGIVPGGTKTQGCGESSHHTFLSEFDHVFGIPIAQVVENDQLLRLQKSESFAPTMQKLSGSGIDEQFGEFTEGGTSSLSESSTVYSGAENSNAASTASFDKVEEISGIPLECDDTDAFPSRSSSVPHTPRVGRINHNEAFEKSLEVKTPPPLSAKLNPATPGRPLRRRGAIGADSFHAIDPHQSQLLQALSLSVSNTSDSGRQEKKEKASVLPPTMTQVPYIVQKCCDYITKCGLDITGIFRIAGSKKRVKQLREEFDRGVDVTIEESYNPHDVAALLKEFFRDLPEALLTRELFPSFLQSTELNPEQRLSFVRYLLWLLPIPNRDSLRTLLRFLYNVAQHCEDSIDEKGQKVTGNLMTVYNLATIFGPNLLHRYKKSTGQSTEVLYQGVERMEDSAGVIKVVEHMINQHIALFEVPKENHDQILRKLKETEPEAVDFILRRKAANYVREKGAQSEQCSTQQDWLSRTSLPDVFANLDDEENINSCSEVRANHPHLSSPTSSQITNCSKQLSDNEEGSYNNSEKSSPTTGIEKQNSMVELRKHCTQSESSISPIDADISESLKDPSETCEDLAPRTTQFIKSHNANNCNNIKVIRKLNRQMRCMSGSVGSNLGQNLWLQKAKKSSKVTFKPTPPTSLPLESKLKMDRDLADYREKLLSQPKRFQKQSEKSLRVKANSSSSLVATAPGDKNVVVRSLNGPKYTKSKTFSSSGLTFAKVSGTVSSSRLPETKV